jgi:competence ComEA-like helix-hairpin-helix protein
MFDIKSIKNSLNPLNAVVVGIIALFICIRIFSNNQENAFIIESMNPSEISETSETSETLVTSVTSSSQTSESVVQTQTSTQTQTAEQTSDRPGDDQPSDDQPNVTTEPLAYSAEMGKTFDLYAFNQLSKDELMTFSGIGEVTAQAILDYRKENGPFSDFNDLLLVKGIGEKKLQKIMTILP